MLTSVFFSATSNAEQVATFIPGESKSGPARQYLSGGKYQDNGYVYISAQVDNGGDKSCVTPAPSSFFSDNHLDIILTAQIFGVFGVDPSKEIPIATYSWSSKDKNYCQSAWKMPVILVPPSPIGVKQGIAAGPGASDEPTILVRLRSSSGSEEKITAYAQSLLGIAAGVTTGGAALTVVGLTNFAGGPAAKYLSDELNKLTKSTADETFQIVIPSSEIASGLSSKQIKLVQAFRYFSEENSKVISEIQAGKRQTTETLRLTFKISTRRTMFDEDNNLVAPGMLPSSSPLLQKLAILNYPRNAGAGFMQGFPTVFQRVNSEAPSFAQKLANKDGSACDPLLVAVHDLGFNKVDRAIVIGAILDDAYPTWRTDAQFYGACLLTEPEIRKTLETIYPEKPFAPPIPVYVDSEVALYNPPWWTTSVERYMRAFKDALYSAPSPRLLRLRNLIGQTPITVSDSLSAPREQQDPAAALDGLQQLSGATVKDVGCIFGFTSSGDNYAGMVFVAVNTLGKLSPYFLIADVRTGADGKAVLMNAWVTDLGSKEGAGYVWTIGQAKFGQRSICSSVDAKNQARTIDTVMAALVKEK